MDCATGDPVHELQSFDEHLTVLKQRIGPLQDSLLKYMKDSQDKDDTIALVVTISSAAWSSILQWILYCVECCRLSCSRMCDENFKFDSVVLLLLTLWANVICSLHCRVVVECDILCCAQGIMCFGLILDNDLFLLTLFGSMQVKKIQALTDRAARNELEIKELQGLVR